MDPQCDISFENCPDKIVYSGQLVAGIASIDVYKPIRVCKLVLYVDGIGECEWCETREIRTSNGGSQTEYTYFRGRDQYLNNITELISNGTEIQPGHYSYNFMFQVPKEAPSSVVEKYGSIHYKVRVLFECDPCKPELEFKTDFVVVHPIDLNLDLKAKFPVQQEEIKRYCCLFCVSDPVVLTATLPHSGFIVGQKIPIKITINNPSNVKISQVELKLKKHIQFRSENEKHKNEEVELCKMSHGSVFSKDKREYNIEMEVPFTVPSLNNPLVTVFNIHYELTIKAKTSGCHMSPSILFPITIGTVPITPHHLLQN